MFAHQGDYYSKEEIVRIKQKIKQDSDAQSVRWFDCRKVSSNRHSKSIPLNSEIFSTLLWACVRHSWSSTPHIRYFKWTSASLDALFNGESATSKTRKTLILCCCIDCYFSTLQIRQLSWVIHSRKTLFSDKRTRQLRRLVSWLVWHSQRPCLESQQLWK